MNLHHRSKSCNRISKRIDPLLHAIIKNRTTQCLEITKNVPSTIFKVILWFLTGAVSPDADEELPDLTAAEVAHAAVKIQAAYKGFKARKVLNKNEDEEMPDLNDVQVQEATVKIQSAFKGFAARKQRAEETKAAIRIQRNFRGFVTRKHGFAHTVEVAQAAIKIQKVYRGFQVIQKNAI